MVRLEFREGAGLGLAIVLVIAALIALILYVEYDLSVRQADCDADHGVLVKARDGWACVKGVG